jgi:CRISPR type I-E-associated protein CasB/Cse2
MTGRSEEVAGLLRYLASIVQDDRRDRGALAGLRRGAGEKPRSEPKMFPLVEPWLPEGMDDRHADAAYRVAALFALHHQGSNRPHDWPEREEGRQRDRNLGRSLRIAGTNDNGELDSGMERRFTALLNARSTDLDHHLRQVFSLLRAKRAETPVDYRQLYLDLVDWDQPDRRVQRRWAEGFWRGGGRDDSTSADVAAGAAAGSDDNDDDNN